MENRGKTGCYTVLAVLAVCFIIMLIVSLGRGGHMPGLTRISPENIGISIDTYHGKVKDAHLRAGLHWVGIFEQVIEVPTATRIIDRNVKNENPIKVNTASNELTLDASFQYRIVTDKADELYSSYRDKFGDIEGFENGYVIPAFLGAVNYAVGDLDSTYATQTEGKQKAAAVALKLLNDEWKPKGIEFSNVAIRHVEPDPESQSVLANTLTKMQEIDNAKLQLERQQEENKTTIAAATADAQINRLKASTLTDAVIKDKVMKQVKKIYVPQETVMGGLR